MIRTIFNPFKATLLAASCLFLAATAFAAQEDEKLESVRATVSGMFEQINPENINPGPIDGWYTIQKGSIVAYISDDGRYLMQGDMIDLEMDINLTEASRNTARWSRGSMTRR